VYYGGASELQGRKYVKGKLVSFLSQSIYVAFSWVYFALKSP
jgi:hypothetical protein